MTDEFDADLPSEFKERLKDSETVSDAEKAKIVESVKLARDAEAPSPSPTEADSADEAPTDQPTPTDAEYEAAKAAGPDAEVTRLAYESLPPSLNPTRELGLGHARAIRARMLQGLPAYETTITEEEYVAREVAETKKQMDAGLLKDPDGLRLERSRLYAVTRYRGFKTGRVASL
jgi:hypothetical protein